MPTPGICLCEDRLFKSVMAQNKETREEIHAYKKQRRGMKGKHEKTLV